MVSVARELRNEHRRVGLIPTMGALHEGHLMLMTRAREMCDTLVISIFVNPTQFGPGEDFERYPRDLPHDAELAFSRGVDLIFAPTPEEMFPEGFTTYVNVEGLGSRLEGASRPGHFKGVTTVVAKLLNIVRPDFVFFGRKDAQQVVLIKRMVRDLAMDVEVVVNPTMRDEDGLALSSRNAYLSPEERRAAPVLRRALERCRAMYNAGDRDADRMISAMRSTIVQESLARIDYLSITDTEKLDRFEIIPPNQPVLVSLAVFIGSTRLIDNIVLNGQL